MRSPNGEIFPAELMHRVGLAKLAGEFATIVAAAALLDRL